MFVVHIGFHKTATTSLQEDVYPYIGEYEFVGRCGGSLKNQDELYLRIAEFCFSSDDIDPVRESEVKNLVLKRLDKSKLLLSEEWLTADYSGLFGFKGATWQTKLDRLSRLLTGVEHKILVSLRDPVDGMFSQYCEFMTVGVDDYYPSFEGYALRSNDAKAYRYYDFHMFISERFSEVGYITFEHIKSDRNLTNLKRFLGVQEMPRLGHHNQKRKSETGVRVEKKKELIIKLLQLTPKPLKDALKKFQIIVFLRNSIVYMFSDKKNIPYPSEQFRRKLESQIKTSYDFLEDLSGT